MHFFNSFHIHQTLTPGFHSQRITFRLQPIDFRMNLTTFNAIIRKSSNVSGAIQYSISTLEPNVPNRRSRDITAHQMRHPVG